MSNANAAQDIDPETGNPLGPTDEVMNEPEANAEDSIESPSKAKQKPADPEPEEVAADEEPKAFSDDARAQIAAKHSKDRSKETAETIDEMEPGQKENVRRMEMEARGDDWDGVKDGDMGDADPLNQAELSEDELSQRQQNQDKETTQETAEEGVDLGDEPITIVVFGERIEVSPQEVQAAGGVEALQKSRAADIRLTRISEHSSRLRDWEGKLRDWDTSLREGGPKKAASTEAAPAEAGPDVRGIAKTIVNTMYEGNEDEAVEALSNALSDLRRGVNQPASTGEEELRRVVREELAASNKQADSASSRGQDPNKEAAEASQKFRNEFPDLQNDPVKFTATRAEIEIVRNDPIFYGRPMEEVVREAGYRSRARFAGLPVPETPSKGPAPVVQANSGGEVVAADSSTEPSSASRDQLQSRYNLKRRTVVAPSTASTAVPVADTDEPQKTNPSDVVANMRKARGLPPQ